MKNKTRTLIYATNNPQKQDIVLVITGENKNMFTLLVSVEYWDHFDFGNDKMEKIMDDYILIGEL